MGFFSFFTQDTDRSIANCHSKRDTFTVYMKDNKGNVWKEENYSGYGNFGGKDFYELAANMNGVASDPIQVEMHGEDEDARSRGISMWADAEEAFAEDLPSPGYIFPSLSEDPNHEWTGDPPLACPDQGYFYDM